MSELDQTGTVKNKSEEILKAHNVEILDTQYGENR